MYRAIFSRRAQKAFLDLPEDQARREKSTIERLADDPRLPGTIKLEHAPVAQYRHWAGNWRIIFDVDDQSETIEILDIRKRDEQTFR